MKNSEAIMMRRKSRLIILNLVLFILFSACVPLVQQDLILNDAKSGFKGGAIKYELDPLNVASIDRGTNRGELHTEFGAPKHSYIVENKSLEYLVEVYPILLRIDKRIVSGSEGSYTEYVYVYGPFYFIYFNDHLWVWGNDEEIMKNNDPALQQIIKTVTKGYVGEELKVRKKLIKSQSLMIGIPLGLFLLVATYAILSS